MSAVFGNNFRNWNKYEILLGLASETELIWEILHQGTIVQEIPQNKNIVILFNLRCFLPVKISHVHIMNMEIFTINNAQKGPKIRKKKQSLKQKLLFIHAFEVKRANLMLSGTIWKTVQKSPIYIFVDK